MFKNVKIKETKYTRIVEHFAINSEEREDCFYNMNHSCPVLTGEDALYLEMKGGRTGMLDNFYEQGMDYSVYLFYDLDLISGTGFFSYEGQHLLRAGDYLEVYTPEGDKIFGKEFTHDVGNSYHCCASEAHVFKERNCGLDPSWFIEEYPAIWIPA